MKGKKPNQKSSFIPTKSEMEILQILWKHGPSTVRAVNNILNEEFREVYYTSTLKIMQIMVDKGWLNRNDDSMTHIYMAAVQEQKTKGQLLDQFVTRTLDRLELPCRYSVVYELTRIECLLNQPAYDDEFVADPLGSLWSISA